MGENEVEIKNSRLKYTTYQISALVEEEIKKYGVNKYNIDRDVLESILNYPKIFSLEMYEASSEVLNLTIEELTKIEIETIKPQFRKKNSCDYIKVEELITSANNLFEEMIFNSKINTKTGGSLE